MMRTSSPTARPVGVAERVIDVLPAAVLAVEVKTGAFTVNPPVQVLVFISNVPEVTEHAPSAPVPNKGFWMGVGVGVGEGLRVPVTIRPDPPDPP